MTHSTPIRLAIVGSGSIAQTHAAAISQLPEAQLVAVCARNEAKARERFPSPVAVFTSMDDLLQLEGLDAVLIATPSGAHADYAIPALRAGKHVLCEKPLEISSERVNSMIREAEKSGTLLAGFFPLRCGAGASAIREALRAGRFGKLTMLAARIKWWRDQEYYESSNWRGTWKLDGGGALMNQGIHAVDLLQWFGGSVMEVQAFGNNLAHGNLEVEDTLAATMRFKNGALGTLSAATSCYPGLDLSIEVSGDCGTAILVNDRIDFWKFKNENPGDEAIRQNQAAGAIKGGSSDPKAISCAGHRAQIADFCRAIRGESSALINGREAARAVAIVEAAYRSTRSGKSEPILTL